jgi:hypothetical protein
MEQANAKSMDISNLANGMYMILFYDETGNRVAIDKFIKQ